MDELVSLYHAVLFLAGLAVGSVARAFAHEAGRWWFRIRYGP